eukprot:982338-Amphidinium_carterae.2
MEVELSEKGNSAETWEGLIEATVRKFRHQRITKMITSSRLILRIASSLPFMAMLKNLRNILLAGVKDSIHQTIIGRLCSAKQQLQGNLGIRLIVAVAVHQVAASKQMPVRFLSAFEAIDFDDATLEKLAEEVCSLR